MVTASIVTLIVLSIGLICGTAAVRFSGDERRCWPRHFLAGFIGGLLVVLMTAFVVFVVTITLGLS